MTNEKAKIAFFGLGNMGVPMATNLLKAGFQVTSYVYGSNTAGADAIRACGARIVETAEEVVDGADVIISSVPADQAVKDIYLKPSIHDHVKDGAIIIEMTSCRADTVREVQAYYEDKGVKVIDAPVTGAKIGAETGNLTIIGAGDPEAFEKAQPIFDVLTRKVYNLGPVGNGKLVKAMTNLMGAVNLAMVGEICRMAKAEGLDMDAFAEVVRDSAGGSTQFDRNFMKMVDADFAPTFTLQLLRKDMGIALEMADDLEGLSMPLGQFAYRLYQSAGAYDGEDCSAIVKVDRIDGE